MNYKKDTTKGHYRLENPSKYFSPRPPQYKSRWEKKLFIALDRNPYVNRWGYECVEIFYLHPIYQKWSVYYPDIFCSTVGLDGKPRVILIEVKPEKYRNPPKRPSQPRGRDAKSLLRHNKAMERFENDNKDWLVNQAKWKAARDWCLKNRVEWLIITEKNVDGFFSSSSI